MEGFSYTEEDNLAHPASEEADAPLRHEDFVALQEKAVGDSLGADYKGNWTNLLHERLKDPKTKEKFLAFKARFPSVETRHSSEFKKKNEDGIALEKPDDLPKDQYIGSIENYDKNLEEVFRSTRYHYAQGTDFANNPVGVKGLESHIPSHGGASLGYGDPGSVFVDAVNRRNEPYSDRSKQIIEAHEKAHGVFGNLTQGEKRHIWNIFGNPKIGYPYKKAAEEVLIRMTQLKNYFGFKGDEPMTIGKLRYAKAHYVENVGLDNNMSEFFDAITPENEQAVVDLMNEYPC